MFIYGEQPSDPRRRYALVNPLRSSERHRMIGFDHDDWFDDVFRATDGSATYAGETGQELKVWQESFHTELRDVFGFPAIRDSAVEDIGPRQQGHPEATARHRSYERRTWNVHAKRRFRVPLYLLLPDSMDPPYPVTITFHDHTKHGRDLAAGVAEGEATGRHTTDDRRDVTQRAARQGFAVAIPDIRTFDELSPDTSDNSDSSGAVSACTRWQKRAQLLSRSLVGERVWDVCRLVDLVEGHSALDDRIGHVVACASVCPFEDSIVPVDHCLCNYVPDLRRLGEVWDITDLIAPRPLRIVAGESGPIFPITGTRRAFGRIQGRYHAADAERKCSLFVGDGGRRFFETGAWPFLRDRL